MIGQVNGIGWLISFLLGLAVLQRRVHFEFQAIFLLITKRVDITILLFSIVFLPGVLLHEISHFLTAKLLRVPTGRFSIIPRPLADGKLQLGYVETSSTDIFRDAMIGIAPLIVGVATIAVISYYQFGIYSPIKTTSNAGLAISWETFSRIYNLSDFWIWFYFIFVISSTMFPSASDRRSWLPLILLLLGVVVVGILLGAGPWMMNALAPGFNQLLLKLSTIFGLSTLCHLILLAPLWVLRMVFVRITGMRIA